MVSDAISAINDVRFVFNPSSLQESFYLISFLCMFAYSEVQYFVVPHLFSFLHCVGFFCLRPVFCDFVVCQFMSHDLIMKHL